MSLRTSHQNHLLAPLAAVVLATIFGGFSLFSEPPARKSGDREGGVPSSKSFREPSSSSPLEEEMASAGTHELQSDEGKSAAVAKREMVLADGTVIKAGEALPKKIAAGMSGGKGVEGRKASLRNSLLERAGTLAVHGEEPWKALVLVAMAYHRVGDKEARQFWFERAIRLATDPDSPLESSLALRDVIKGLTSVGEIEQSLDLIRRIPHSSHRDQATASVVRAIVGRKNFDQALGLARQIDDSSARVLAIRSIAEAQARFGFANRALETVGTIPSGKSRDDALTRVALALSSAGDSTGASRIVNTIHDARRRDLALARLVENASRGRGAGSPETYLSLLHDPYLRDESLLHLVEQQVGRLKFSEAQVSASKIRRKSDKAVAMELLVTLQLRLGHLGEAKKRARAIEVKASRERALQSVALQQVVSQGPPAARFTADLIETPKVRDSAYRKIAERVASLGNNGQIAPTIGEIQNPVERASACASVARLQARRGLLAPARSMLSEAEAEVRNIAEPRRQEMAMSMLATAHLETGDETTAMRTAAGIADTGLRDQTYQQLARKFAGLSDIALAEESAHAIQKETTRERALDEVARVVAGRTRATEALGRLKMFESRRQQVNFLLEVARRI